MQLESIAPEKDLGYAPSTASNRPFRSVSLLENVSTTGSWVETLGMIVLNIQLALVLSLTELPILRPSAGI